MVSKASSNSHECSRGTKIAKAAKTDKDSTPPHAEQLRPPQNRKPQHSQSTQREQTVKTRSKTDGGDEKH
ncbi:hypothetical protein A2U01_0049360 [Trifolium medium]|uniref:Uncharacterized protein n=1 Tax=Trifolium medium TaxID=97028 RepID=A0A392QX37_9FABA|nr:hypothetical protein [Trifolium medium]